MQEDGNKMGFTTQDNVDCRDYSNCLIVEMRKVPAVEVRMQCHDATWTEREDHLL